MGRIDDDALFELTTDCILLFALMLDLLSVASEVDMLDNVDEVGVEALFGDAMVLGDEDESGVLFKFKSLSSLSLLLLVVLALVVLALVLVLMVVLVDVFASGFVLGILKLLVLNVIAPKPNTDCGGVFGLIKLNMSCFLDLSFLTMSVLVLDLLSTPICVSLTSRSLVVCCAVSCSALSGDGVVNEIELVNEGDGVRLFECEYD